MKPIIAFSKLVVVNLSIFGISLQKHICCGNVKLSVRHTASNTRTNIMSGLTELSYEKDMWSRSYKCVIGCDEVGRGPLAGPVVATAVYIPRNFIANEVMARVADSKSISENTRNSIYQETIGNSNILHATVFIDNICIDNENILQSSLRAMKEAIEEVHKKVKQTCDELEMHECIALIDGNKTPSKLLMSSKPIIAGDTKVYSIALASIIAKVRRDNLMKSYDEMYPEYGFAKHKGYPTKTHIFAIHKFGPCDIHRLSFKPLKGRQHVISLTAQVPVTVTLPETESP